jgi:hypothetical protein
MTNGSSEILKRRKRERHFLKEGKSSLWDE